MAGNQVPPVGGPDGPGRPGRVPVGYAARGAGGRPAPYAGPSPTQGAVGRPPAGPAGPQGYEPYPTVRPPSRQTGGGGGFIDYPRHNRQGWSRWVPSWKLVTAIMGLGLLSLVLLFSIVYANTTVPQAMDQKVLEQTTVFYYANGTTELGRSQKANRQAVKLATIPPHVRRAVLAAEDRTFYRNSGISPAGIVRAAWSNARGNSTQGGSTITQQFVKNAYAMQQKRSVTTKLKEFVLAIKIDQSTDKDVILEDYLNAIYFGRNAYGIQAASQAYFRKNVQQLNVSEAAYLAGIINAPSLADKPDKDHPDHLARAQRRHGVVLDAMVAEGWLTQPERSKYTKLPKIERKAESTSLKGQAGYLVQMAEAEAARKLSTASDPVTEDDIATGGYKIVTTFNQRMITAAEDAVNEFLPAATTPKRVKAGLAAVNPKTGAVYAIYGGKDYLKSQFNTATMARPEGGSTFKAFGLLAALDNDVSLDSRFRGTSPMTFKGTPVKNFGGEQYYNIDLREATQKSVNTVYVQLNEEVGPKKARLAAEAAGLPADAGMKDNTVNVLGSAAPHTLDMAATYATFAAEGRQRDPYVVKSITLTQEDKVIWNDKGKTDGEPAFDKDVIADLTSALQGPVNGGTGSYAGSNLGRPAAGKTGTSNDSRSAWFVGYTPQISVAVSMYQTSKDGKRNIEMQGWGGFGSITGGSFPVRIWTAFTKEALKNQPVLQFPPASNIGERIGIPAPQPTYTPQPSEQPSAQPSVQPSEQPQQPEPSVGLPEFPGFGENPGQGQDQGQDGGDTG